MLAFVCIKKNIFKYTDNDFTLIMADVLENLLSGKITVKNLIEWLLSDNSKVFEHLNFSAKADFVLCFLNFLKDSCSWLVGCNSHINETVERNNTKLLVKKLNYKVTLRQSDYCCHPTDRFSAGKKNGNQAKQFIAKNGGNEQIMLSSSNKVSNCKKTIAPDINSCNVFPPLSVNDTSKKTFRRITPTPVQFSNKRLNSSKFSNSVFCVPEEKTSDNIFKSSPFLENSKYNLQQEREMIKKTKETLFNVSHNSIRCKSEKVNNASNKNIPLDYVVPDPSLVSSEDKLEIFVETYNCFLNHGLVSNVTAELYFIFQLLTCKVPTNGSYKFHPGNIFYSVHNCVFFAVSVLNNQHDMLSLLDKGTLLTLVKIPSVHHFSSGLALFLLSCCEEIDEKKTKLSVLSCVPYQVEDENKDNFPDDNSFYNFKKQRDLFYELLRVWQQQHLNVDSNFQRKFTYKVIKLINLSSRSAANFYHLAQLIQAQLIASCLCLEVDEAYDELLTDIKYNFPDKFYKLQERFSIPSNVGNVSPPQSFYGIQLFFCELIETASSADLNRHLIDNFVTKILNLNNVNMSEEIQSVIQVKEIFLSVLHTLRLLAKFLGFVQFLPYKMSGQLPKKLLKDQLAARQNTLPVLNIKELIENAVSQNYLILTVPWVVEYLSLMDAVSLNLKYNQEIFEMLADIYRGKFISILDKRSFLFLRLIIGWLFDVQKFPLKLENVFQHIAFKKYQCNAPKGLDYHQIVDKQLIYSCCPYLIEFRILTDEFLNGIKSKNKGMKKITPVTTNYKNLTSSYQQFELQLEENFYILHPSSFKKTIEFVAERIASKVISKIRSMVTNIKLTVVKNISTSSSFNFLLLSNMEIAEKHQEITTLIDLNAPYWKKEIKMEANCLAKDKALSLIKIILPSLLPEETKAPVLEICVKLSFQLTNERIYEWCEANIDLDEIKSDIANKLQFYAKVDITRRNDVESKLFSAYSIDRLRKAILKLHLGVETLSTLEINQMCTETSLFINKDCMTKGDVELQLSLLIDLCVSVLIFSPQNWSTELRDTFLLIFLSFPKNYALSNYFLCPQNLCLLKISRCSELSVNAFIQLLACLVNSNYCSFEKIEDIINYRYPNILADEFRNFFLSTIKDNLDKKHNI